MISFGIYMLVDSNPNNKSIAEFIIGKLFQQSLVLNCEKQKKTKSHYLRSKRLQYQKNPYFPPTD